MIMIMMHLWWLPSVRGCLNFCSIGCDWAFDELECESFCRVAAVGVFYGDPSLPILARARSAFGGRTAASDADW